MQEVKEKPYFTNDSLRNTKPQWSNQINLPDTLNLKLGSSIEITNGNSSPDRMPWIVALIIGILTVIINYIIARILRNSNSINIQSQIKNSKENLQVQIENEKQLKNAQFQITLRTQNKQENLNNFIETLTEFLSYSVHYTPDSTLDNDKSYEIVNSIYISKIKLELLLNPKHEIHNNILTSLNEMIEVITLEPKDFDIKKLKIVRDKCFRASRELIKEMTEEINQIEIR